MNATITLNGEQYAQQAVDTKEAASAWLFEQGQELKAQYGKGVWNGGDRDVYSLVYFPKDAPKIIARFYYSK